MDNGRNIPYQDIFFITHHAVIKARKAFFSERWETTKAEENPKVCTSWGPSGVRIMYKSRNAVQAWATELRVKRKKIPKFVQAEALPESEIMYKSKDRCTGMKDRITRDREIQRYAKTYQKPSPQTSVHLEQQVELRKKVESGSTIADSEAA